MIDDRATETICAAELSKTCPDNEVLRAA